MITKSIKKNGHRFIYFVKAPLTAKTESLKDLTGLPQDDSGPSRAIDEALMWLEKAQDHSITKDGGVAAHYSYLYGWGPSYPETTGYIIPTIIKHAKERNSGILMDRAERMLKWLVSIQLSEGCFQAGTIDAKPVVPCTFNTGQILLGLTEGVRTFGRKYREPMRKAANWLVETQDKDGCWRKFPTPYAVPGEKSYETHVAWGLLKAAEVDSNKKYLDSALKNVNWAIGQQNDNGWFDKCCLTDPLRPLTHTLGYVFRGLLEAYIYSKDEKIFAACKKMADGLITTLRDDGFLPGRILASWDGSVPWACLTGSVQIAYCWLSMYKITGKEKYLRTASSVNKYVRRTQKTSGPKETRGGIKGSFPIFGEYGRFQFLNWAAKFFIDSNSKEVEINSESSISCKNNDS